MSHKILSFASARDKTDIKQIISAANVSTSFPFHDQCSGNSLNSKKNTIIIKNKKVLSTFVLDWTCSLQMRHFLTLGEHREQVAMCPHGPNKVSLFISEHTIHSSNVSESLLIIEGLREPTWPLKKKKKERTWFMHKLVLVIPHHMGSWIICLGQESITSGPWSEPNPQKDYMRPAIHSRFF